MSATKTRALMETFAFGGIVHRFQGVTAGELFKGLDARLRVRGQGPASRAKFDRLMQLVVRSGLVEKRAGGLLRWVGPPEFDGVNLAATVQVSAYEPEPMSEPALYERLAAYIDPVTFIRISRAVSQSARPRNKTK